MALSILLVSGWIWAIRKGHTQFQWTTLIALALLLVLLFPAISMTDDRAAMSAPTEMEHMMRRSEAPLVPVALPGLIGALAALMLIFLSVPLPGFFCRLRPRIFAETLLAGFIRAFGVRPPPAAALLAC